MLHRSNLLVLLLWLCQALPDRMKPNRPACERTYTPIIWLGCVRADLHHHTGRLRMKVLIGRVPAPALRMLIGFAFLAQVGSGALAAPSDESDAKMFSLEQKVKIAQLVTKRTRALANVGFPVAVERTVPS